MSHRVIPSIPQLADPSNDVSFAAFVAQYTANAAVKDMLARALKVDPTAIAQWGTNANLPDLATREILVRWIQGCPSATQ